VFVCSGLVDAETLGASAYPLYDAALATGKLVLIIVLFVGTIAFCIASANGCINDASGPGSPCPRQAHPRFFGKVHPKYNSP
jgi:ethanolamine permease